MRIKSPLSNLSDAISLVKASAAQYQQTLQNNEAATRAVLIDPILRSLGWDTANTNMVEVEKTLASTRVDYALYDHNADVRIVVEAKPLDRSLRQQSIAMNLVKYAFTYSIQDIFLTDGLVWEHYTNFQPGNIIEKTIDFSKDDPVDCAAYLVQWLDAAKFWPEEQTIDTVAQQVAQLESTVSTLKKELALVQSNQDKDLSAQTPPLDKVRATPSEVPSADQQEPNFTLLNKNLKLTGTRPSLLRLPDDTVIKVSRWKDVLRECCKYVLANNPEIILPLPDRAGRKVNLLNTVRPTADVAYIEEEHKGQPIYIYVNYDSNNCVSNARHVLAHLPATASKVEAAVVYAKE